MTEYTDITDFCETLWTNWRNDELSEMVPGGWKYTDTSKFYYPLYGLGHDGDESGDLMIVAQSPAWNVCCRDGLGTKRPTEHYPSSDDHDDRPDRYAVLDGRLDDGEWPVWEEFRCQEKHWRAQRAEANNTMYQVMTTLVTESNLGPETASDDIDPFQYLYFTNLQKDGEFGSRKKNGLSSGLTWAQCNRESRAFWSEILKQEIETLDPSVIVTFGKEAAAELYRYAHDLDQPIRFDGVFTNCILDGQRYQRHDTEKESSTLSDTMVFFVKHWSRERSFHDELATEIAGSLHQ